jgi:hypothetical protein
MAHTGEVCAVREPAFAVIRFEVVTIVKMLLKPAVFEGTEQNISENRNTEWACVSGRDVTQAISRWIDTAAV